MESHCVECVAASFSGIAALPRIVTLHDITIKSEKGLSYDDLLLELTARTYRYLDDEEVASVEADRAAADKKSSKKKKKDKA